jgi:NADH-quinone oxidoreductase subunit N
VTSAILAQQAFTAPELDLFVALPIALVIGAGVVGVLVDAFVPHTSRAPVQLAVALSALAASAVVLVLSVDRTTVTFAGALAVDGPALALQGLVVLFTALALLLYTDQHLDPAGDPFTPSGATIPGGRAEQVLTERRVRQTEVYPLTMFAAGGMMLMASAADLLTMFVALEVLSLPLYILAGLARRRRLLSQEAAMKYFLLGAFASAFFLYGVALLYGAAGSVRLVEIDEAVSARVGVDGLLLAGTGLLAVGLLFKIGAAPFHVWTPDVYQGSPTPVTAFMSAATKAGAFIALMRVFYVGLGGLADTWVPVLSAVAILSMLLGSVVALSQTDIKRVLAYSSIAHAGFLLVGLVALSETGLAAVLVYLAVYGVASIGSFALVTFVRDAGGEATHLSAWAGLGRRSPWVAGTFALMLLSLAGIPLTAGFIGKLAVFGAAIDGGAIALVIIALLASAIAAFFYVRIIVLMFFTDPSPTGPTVGIPGAGTVVCIAVCAVLTVAAGVFPGPLLELGQRAAAFLA